MTTFSHAQACLPDYVVINSDQIDEKKAVLRAQCEPVVFPLSEEDRAIVSILEAKFDQEENCAGLAACQIGFNKQIIVFAVSDDPELQKWRPDLVETLPKTIWINPRYEAIGDERHSDYEGCFSVHDLAGSVNRSKTIRYEAYLPSGEKVEGVAKGFLARVIQHEIDHTRGVLFIDYVEPEKLFSIEVYRKMRSEALEKSLQER